MSPGSWQAQLSTQCDSLVHSWSCFGTRGVLCGHFVTQEAQHCCAGSSQTGPHRRESIESIFIFMTYDLKVSGAVKDMVITDNSVVRVKQMYTHALFS